MSDNKNLQTAKKAKNDEFYTRLDDIEKELTEYDPAVFENKSIRNMIITMLLKLAERRIFH